jgi:PiT family inorganic phosphate transporter
LSILLFVALAGLFVAYANGANDNFKGVATLFGSGTTRYGRALAWATATTFAGSMMSIVWAQELVRRFSGKGFVPDMLAGTPEFVLAVASGAGLTVILATRFGFPLWTNHSLVGGILGAGAVLAGPELRLGALGRGVALPLRRRLS